MLKSFVVLVSVLTLAACTTVPQNLPLSAEVSVETATIVASQEGAFYLFIVELSPAIPENSNAVIEYQRLSDPRQRQSLDLGGMGDSKRITFKSNPDSALQVNHDYQIILTLYESSRHSTPLAQRTSLIRAQVPPRVAQLFDIELL